MDEKSLLQSIEKMLDSKLDSKLEPIKSDLSVVKDRVLKLEITMENQVLPGIALLAEGQVSLSNRLERLDDLPEKVEDIQSTVSVLKYAFKEHVNE